MSESKREREKKGEWENYNNTRTGNACKETIFYHNLP